MRHDWVASHRAVPLLCAACRSRRRSGRCPRDGTALDMAIVTWSPQAFYRPAPPRDYAASENAARCIMMRAELPKQILTRGCFRIGHAAVTYCAADETRE